MRENSRETLLQCALALFAAKGYEGTGPNEIAELAGVKKPTLYHFFGSKEGLFAELLRICYGELLALLENSCRYVPHPAHYSRDVYPALLRTVETYFRFAERNRDFYTLALAMEFLPPSSKAAALAERYQTVQYRILQGMFEAIADIHHNLKGKENVVSRRFLALVNAQIGLWMRGHADLGDPAAASLVSGFLHGIFS